jgi:hypothetical protein
MIDNNNLTKEQVERVRKTYPIGTRLELTSPLNDPHFTLTTGDRGTVTDIFDNGDIGMKWDKNSTLHLLPYYDNFKIVPSLSPKAVEGLIAVRKTARTNMLDLTAVQIIANELNYFDTVIAIEEQRKLVANFIFTGETEVNDNAKIK